MRVNELLDWKWCDIWSLSDCNGIRTYNHLVGKRKLNHLVTLATLVKCLIVHLPTKWLWVRISLQSTEYQISRLLRARCSLTLRQLECRYTLKHLCDMIRAYSQMHRTDRYSQHSSIIKASLVKWLSVCLQTRWLWVRFPLQSLKNCQISYMEAVEKKASFLAMILFT